MRLTVKNPRPLFRRNLRMAPGHPRGDRIIVREFPVESTTEGGLALADTAKERYMAGTIVAAGDQAADAMWDGGDLIGDEIWYAKYAGVIQEWQHIAGKDDLNCAHDGSWDYVPAEDKRWLETEFVPNENTKLRACRTCGTLKVSERVIVMAVSDIHVNVDLQCRLEAGTMRRVRGHTADLKTKYFIERDDERDCFETVTQMPRLRAANERSQ